VIGSQPVRSISVPIMHDALLLMERRGALVALRKVRMWASLVFRYAIATGRADAIRRLPARHLQDKKAQNFAAVTKADESASCSPPFALPRKPGHTLCPHALATPSCARVSSGGAEWSEFDMEAALWRIPAERMKMGAKREPSV
jgi:hypothetical protein